MIVQHMPTRAGIFYPENPLISLILIQTIILTVITYDFDDGVIFLNDTMNCDNIRIIT